MIGPQDSEVVAECDVCMSVGPAIDARAQFVAVACGVFVERCGYRSALRALPPSVIVGLGMNWVVRVTRHAAKLINNVRFRKVTGFLDLCVYLGLSPTMGVVSCRAWRTYDLRTISKIGESGRFVVLLSSQDTWLMDSHGQLYKRLYHDSSLRLKPQSNSKKDEKFPGVTVDLQFLWGRICQAVFLPGDGNVLALTYGLENFYNVMFFDLPQTFACHSIMTARSAIICNLPGALDLLWVSPDEMLMVNYPQLPTSEEPCSVYNTVTKKEKKLPSQYTVEFTYPPSHLVVFSKEDSLRYVFCSSDFDTPCNTIQGRTLEDASLLQGTGVLQCKEEHSFNAPQPAPNVTPYPIKFS